MYVQSLSLFYLSELRQQSKKIPSEHVIYFKSFSFKVFKTIHLSISSSETIFK